MKKLFLLSICFLCLQIVFAQVPQAFNYQAVARNQQGNVLANKTIGVRIALLNDNNEVYSESHKATTNPFGLFTIQVGQGSVLTGSFSNINWNIGLKAMKVGIDPAGGTSYLDMGTSPLLTVPFAMVASQALSVVDQSLSGLKDVDTTGKVQGYLLGWDGTKWKPISGVAQQGWLLNNGDLTNVNPSGKIGLGVNTPEAKLHIEGNDKEKLIAFKGSKYITSRSNGTDYGVTTSGEGLYLSSENGNYKQAYYFTDGNPLDTTPIFGIASKAGTGAWSPALNVSHQGMVGIGVAKPKAKLHVQNGGLLLQGTIGGVDFKGDGTAMLWIPNKSAFRAGSANNKSWDNDSIGLYSFASGRGTRATGPYSTAMGAYSLALGNSSVALGASAQALSSYTIALGNAAIASGVFSTAIGQSTSASGYYATSIGYNTISRSCAGIALGSYNDITDNDFNPSSLFNDENRIFQVGNGTNASNRKNALTILQNGNVGIGVLEPSKNLSVAGSMNIDQQNANTGTIQNTLTFGNGSGEGIGSKRNAGEGQNGLDFYTNMVKRLSISYSGNTTVLGNLTVRDSLKATIDFSGKAFILNGDIGTTNLSGDGTRLMWIPEKGAFRAGYASNNSWNINEVGDFSVALGNGTKASGYSSTSLGYLNNATGNFSTAIGSQNAASGEGSFATGMENKASGDYATAFGRATIASGRNAASFGEYSTTASGRNSLAGGDAVKVSGDNSFGFGSGVKVTSGSSVAFGVFTVASGSSSAAFGAYVKARGNRSMCIGVFNDTTSLTHLFEVGNGTADNNRKNAFYVDMSGNAVVQNNLTVKNNKGIIRSSDASQQKIVKTNTTINQTIGAGSTVIVYVNWSETFSSTPVAYVGNASGGGFAEVTMSVANVSSSGASLYIYNGRNSAASVNYNVNLIAIGAE